jgi:hypothetical protein
MKGPFAGGAEDFVNGQNQGAALLFGEFALGIAEKLGRRTGLAAIVTVFWNARAPRGRGR